MREFDLCVIGSGPAGQKAAIQSAKLGRSACVIERDALGGCAINTGTIPSKALREAILRLLGRVEVMPTIGDFAAAKNLALSELLSSCQEVVKAEVSLVQRHFKSNGISVLQGTGRFKDANTIEVVGEHSIEEIRARNILIAVGTSPSRPPDLPFDGKILFTSDEILKVGMLPKSMIVVGGGVIGTEYASMFAALGVKVTLVEGRSRLLDFVDAEIIEALQYHLRQKDVTLRLGERVVSIGIVEVPEPGNGGTRKLAEATLESGKTLRGECLMYAVGRQGNTDGLNLAAAGLSADDRGRIKINASGQTAVPNIFAAGDVIGFPSLASTSMEQGRLAACGMFGEKCETIGNLLPYGIYAVPEISMVGWTEEKLTAEGIPYEAGVAQYKEIARGQLLRDEIGMLKLLIHQETHTVLGVHIIGTGATELVHIGQLAIAFNATVEQIVNTVFNYPTLAECYKVAALNGLNKLKNM